MGSRLDEADSVAVAERVKRRWQGVLIVESLLPHNYRDQISDELYNQTDERMKESCQRR
jgi:hypothetical protein